MSSLFDPKFLKRLGEQAVVTFAVVFVGVLANTSVSAVGAAASAGVAAALRTLYGLLVKNFGDQNAPSVQ